MYFPYDWFRNNNSIFSVKNCLRWKWWVMSVHILHPIAEASVVVPGISNNPVQTKMLGWDTESFGKMDWTILSFQSMPISIWNVTMFLPQDWSKEYNCVHPKNFTGPFVSKVKENWSNHKIEAFQLFDLVGNVPEMSWTCPQDKDVSLNCEDIVKLLAMFSTFFALSHVCKIALHPVTDD